MAGSDNPVQQGRFLADDYHSDEEAEGESVGKRTDELSYW